MLDKVQSALAAALAIGLSLGLASCKGSAKQPAGETEAPVLAASEALTISVIGTNDVHGHVGRLAIFGGYLHNLRAAREDGAVIVLDGGDMFQGTLESNPNEGSAVVRAYNALGYSAAAIGNHEFDFGPVGPKAIPEDPGDDPQGALRARAAEAVFPFLGANIVSKESGKTPDWKNVAASTIVEVKGIKIGLIGVTTIDTPKTTISANLAGLDVLDPATAIEREATALRSRGATAVLVTAHAGASCRDFHDPSNTSSCRGGEIFAVANRLPTGLVDVIVAGHTHAGVAHRVNGIAIIEAYANGRAFGRVDMFIRSGVLKKTVIFPPRRLCANKKASETCEPGTYEGAPVREDREVAVIITEAETAAAEERSRPLGAIAATKIPRAYRAESALGNLFVDLMIEARPTADVAITNGGGLRADIPKGPVTYGALFRAMPFDNRFAFVTLSAAKLAELFERNLRASSGVMSVAGVEVRARCASGKVRATIFRRGARVAGKTMLKVVTSDFLASGGDSAFSVLGLPKDAVVFEERETIRDAMAEALGKRKQPLDESVLLVKDKPRLSYPGKRPVVCK